MEFLAWLESTSFPTWIRESPSVWGYDFVLSSHAIGMAAVVGLSAGVALRILGFAPGLPLAPMRKFFPFMIAGFWISVVSGAVLFAAYPVKAITNPGFFIKMGGIAVALVCLRRIMYQVYAAQAAGTPVSADARFAPTNGRVAAGTLLFSWWVTITAGRLMAYHDIENVEWEASLAIALVSAALLAGFLAVRSLHARKPSGQTA
jgi:hypothetical protein